MNWKHYTLLLCCTAVLFGCNGASKKQMAKLQQDASQHEKQIAKLQIENKNLKAKQTSITQDNETLHHEILNHQQLITKLESKGAMVTLQNSVLFVSGSAKLSTKGRAALDEVVPMLIAKQAELIRIEGHTDSLPVDTKSKPFADNWDLSALRAAAVVRYFVWAHHFPQDLFRVEGRGAVEPLASNDTAEGRAQNRRIEIRVE